MFKLDNNFLIELGLGSLPNDEKNKMLAHIYETLEMRVGMRLADQMSEQQLTEFESFIDSNNEAGALQWLESNFPNYKQVVADELEKLKGEIKQVAPQIVAQAQVAAQAAPQQPQMQMPPQAPQMPQQPLQQPGMGMPTAQPMQYPDPSQVPQYQQPPMPQQPYQPPQDPNAQQQPPAQYPPAA